MSNYPENSFPSFDPTQPSATGAVPSYVSEDPLPADSPETLSTPPMEDPSANLPAVPSPGQDPYLQYTNEYPQQASPYGTQTAPQNPYAQYQQPPQPQNPYTQYQQPPQPQNPYMQYQQQAPQNFQAPYAASLLNQHSKMAAGILAIFLGSFGVHNFYLGRTNRAVTQLLITILSLGFLSPISAIWSFIEGILILTAAPGTQPWGVDGNGVPLSS